MTSHQTTHAHPVTKPQSTPKQEYSQFQWGRFLLFTLIMIPIVVGAWLMQRG